MGAYRQRLKPGNFVHYEGGVYEVKNVLNMRKASGRGSTYLLSLKGQRSYVNPGRCQLIKKDVRQECRNILKDNKAHMPKTNMGKTLPTRARRRLTSKSNHYR